MTIPYRHECMKPVLKAFADGKAKVQKEVETIVASILNLSNEELEHLLPSKVQTVIADRVSWAISHMQKADLLVKVDNRGCYKITDTGLKVLNDNMHDAWKLETPKLEA
ncbi:MAG: winged helix-turn-helix domain-containing protein [Endomicrobiaceae bacterium]|nr:winged helix-turn-helix domain-containing protein [Endomicrobiaceae bacterium]